ncbi:uncharacterized [Tachysurus ichikawai]
MQRVGALISHEELNPHRATAQKRESRDVCWDQEASQGVRYASYYITVTPRSPGGRPLPNPRSLGCLRVMRGLFVATKEAIRDTLSAQMASSPPASLG